MSVIGLPSFTMVGFPSAQVREAQERVRTAFKNNRLSLPPKRVTVNFAPADMKKEGAGFDPSGSQQQFWQQLISWNRSYWSRSW